MAAIKMDELLVSWLGSDDVYEKVLTLIENNRSSNSSTSNLSFGMTKDQDKSTSAKLIEDPSSSSFEGVSKDNSIPPPSKTFKKKRNAKIEIPPFYTPGEGRKRKGRKPVPFVNQSWKAILSKIQSLSILQDSNSTSGNINMNAILPSEQFHQITKDICGFPSFFNGPLYRRIMYHAQMYWEQDQKHQQQPFPELIFLNSFQRFWEEEMEKFDPSDRFFRLVKHPDSNYISKDDFLPYIEELLACHPGLEFLSNHAEFQEKYAITVITRIFYSVNTCHNGKITCRQIRKSDLLESFHAVDAEEDINKITRYFSYEHFYVLYCRFWELDHDRDYRITRDDLLKYGEHSLSHMIVDRIFDAAPRPFQSNLSSTNADNNKDGNNENVESKMNIETNDSSDMDANALQLSTSSQDGGNTTINNREYLSYEDFIFFMLSEEDKANEISVRYWFSCVDVDGDGKLNNMEMRSFYAVQLHRMQCLGHDIVPFEDMLCQMIDMIKPKSQDHIVVEDFLQAECSQVSGALFDALFNLNKYLQFEQRDPFMERQKREDEFESDWDRFAYIDYNRLAMEEEAREEEAMEIDWVTVDDDDDDDDGDEFNSLGLGGASEAPF